MEVLDFKGVENRRKVVRLELDVNDGTNDGFYGADSTFSFGCICASYSLNDITLSALVRKKEK